MLYDAMYGKTQISFQVGGGPGIANVGDQTVGQSDVIKTPRHLSLNVASFSVATLRRKAIC